jgi:hypothetical protein
LQSLTVAIFIRWVHPAGCKPLKQLLQMKNIKSWAAIAALAVLAACSGGPSKKVLVMASGKLATDANNKGLIKLNPGTQHNETTLQFKADEKVVTVESPTGKKEYALPEDGLYILNLKTDTLIGSYQSFGEGMGETRITQEKFQERIDSLQQLLLGQNVSDAKRNYFILPGDIKKVTANTDAQVFGPYQ